MVNLNLIVEGGIYTSDVLATTASNVESLRQSLHSFFSRLLNREDISITLFLGTGYRNATKKFIDADNPIFLYVDSDYPPKSLDLWFDSLLNKLHPEKSIIIPDDKKQFVFFMIQEMEAWFLKQPGCMEIWASKEGYIRVEKQLNIESHSVIRGKNIECIKKPSEKLAIIMKKFFKKGKKGANYGKLKNAPGLLDALDVTSLIPIDLELQRFQTMINTNF